MSGDIRRGNWAPRQRPNTKDEDSKFKWAALRRRYEWDDSYDEGIAPKDEQLENELFGEESHVNTGINFEKYNNIKVSVKGKEIIPISNFEEAKLHDVMKENVKLAKYEIPTPVQKYSIPIITDNYDLMACAQTGSGKTAAFLIPILSKLFGKAKKLAATRPTPNPRKIRAEPLVLIIAPTRELVTQIFDECRRFCYRSMMRPCVVYGGPNAPEQKSELNKGCDVLAATPGRLIDFLDRGIVSLRRVKFLVIDEADRMLTMGFEEDVRKIVQKSDILDDGSRQTLMFSATFPKTIQDLAKDFLLDNYIFLTVGRVGGTTTDITQKVLYVEDQEKRTKLVELLLSQPPSRTLIFVNSKRGADSLDDYLYNQNFPTTSIHGDRTQKEREDALTSFKSGRSPILIATAVAARGLDIKNVMHVINYDLCDTIDEYVHRIGRTARVGNKGLATTFYNESNSDIAHELVKILEEYNQEIPEFLNFAKSGDQNNNKIDYANWDDNKSQNQAPSWDNKSQNQAPSWDNKSQNQAPSWDNKSQNQAPSWDNSNVTWEDKSNPPQEQWKGGVKSWDEQPQQTVASRGASNVPSNAYGSQKQESSPPPPYNIPQSQQYNSQQYHSSPQYTSSQYNSPQYNTSQPQLNTQPIVNLPKSNNQFPSHNSQYPPPQQNFVSSGGYNNPEPTPYNGNNNNNNNYNSDHDANRNFQRPPRNQDNEVTHILPVSSEPDGWGSHQGDTQPKKEWDGKSFPW